MVRLRCHSNCHFYFGGDTQRGYSGLEHFAPHQGFQDCATFQEAHGSSHSNQRDHAVVGAGDVRIRHSPARLLLVLYHRYPAVRRMRLVEI